jgi:diguanylate cyclase (GGDEF)-like protein
MRKGQSPRNTAHAVRWAAGSVLFAGAALLAGFLLGGGSGGGALALSGGALAVGATAWAIGLGRTIHDTESLALRDALTGLPNRTLLADRVEQSLARARRSGGAFALILVDLDGFKEVNDFRGHRAGDAVLKTIATRLESVVRASDTVARVGGDEFVILSLDARTEEQAAALVGRLRHALRRPYPVEGVTVEIDASIGWALFPTDGATSDELIARADGQMYATKRETGEATPRRLDGGIVREFELALERREVVVHYQPVIELPAGAVRRVEALVRREHPDRGVLSPAEFVPHVERTPVIRALTLHVVAEALQHAELWRSRGHELGVSVNVPYRSLDDEELIAGLVGLMESSATPPQTLTLEIVPSGPGAGAELDDAALTRLSAMGVRLSLDDFGRASSLTALRQLPLDEVKVDAYFVHAVERHRADTAVVRALVDLAHALELDVVAEGVESRENWDALCRIGCDFAQGFYIAPPATADELTTWLEHSWPAVAELAS